MEFGAIVAIVLFGNGAVWQFSLSWFLSVLLSFLSSFASGMIVNFKAGLPQIIIPFMGGISFIFAVIIDVFLFMVLIHAPSPWIFHLA